MAKTVKLVLSVQVVWFLQETPVMLCSRTTKTTIRHYFCGKRLSFRRKTLSVSWHNSTLLYPI